MAHHFKKHYTLEQARALLPQIRKWLKEIAQVRAEIEKQEERIGARMLQAATGGAS
jgi:hypothetical protein